ncbi:MAG: hypothetical protein IJI50_07660 [Ruminococcus sp.]|nr:hypothetical protein [Ruminococcus sp.]
MTAFASLSALTRALFALWALLLCLTVIGNAVLATVRRRYRFTVIALLILAPVYFLWQVIFDLSLFGASENAAEISRTLGGLPWLLWFLALTILSVSAALLLRSIIRYNRSFITPGAIKLFLDRMPCGVCCWIQSGRVLFSNICMNRLCTDITDAPLLNGNQFRDAVADGILHVNGRVWRFVSREIEPDGERLYEMIATDITSEYAKTEVLERDKAELTRLNHELSEYYLSIDETVRRQEILQAKMNIHDEMNRLMLSTVAADSKDAAALDAIFSLWEQNALLMCMEAQKKANGHDRDDIDTLAKALGLRLICHDDPPAELSGSRRELVYLTAQEAVVNAVKHAQAKRMEISFARTDSSLSCILTNNGTLPSEKVRFTGGLMNLSRLAQRQGATLTADVTGVFTLTLSFSPKKSAD